MAAQYVTHEEFDEYKRFTSKYFDNIDRRLNTIENTQSEHSVRLSAIETRLKVIETDIASLRAEMQAGFAKVDAQMKELRHMMGFLITHLGLILPPQPED